VKACRVTIVLYNCLLFKTLVVLDKLIRIIRLIDVPIKAAKKPKKNKEF